MVRMGLQNGQCSQYMTGTSYTDTCNGNGQKQYDYFTNIHGRDKDEHLTEWPTLFKHNRMSILDGKPKLQLQIQLGLEWYNPDHTNQIQTDGLFAATPKPQQKQLQATSSSRGSSNVKSNPDSFGHRIRGRAIRGRETSLP